jgi:cardiolipin synthase
LDSAIVTVPNVCRAQSRNLLLPLENRELNQFGKPGKLHAKAAIVDDQALLSSANLTDDAFLRNLGLGALFTGGDMPKQDSTAF